MDFSRERNRMVEDQIIPRGVSNPEVLRAMRKVPRHLFVEQGLWDRAYDDYPLSIGEGQTISQPYMVASMTEELKVTENDSLLEIGTGSGYQTAILAEMAEMVFSIERIESLAVRARETLESLGYENVRVKVGDGTLGWEEFSPYDAILITAGAPDVPELLFEQLKVGGRMVLPIGGGYSQVLTVVEKRKRGLRKRSLFGCVFVPLIGEYGWREEY